MLKLNRVVIVAGGAPQLDGEGPAFWGDPDALRPQPLAAGGESRLVSLWSHVCPSAFLGFPPNLYQRTELLPYRMWRAWG